MKPIKDIKFEEIRNTKRFVDHGFEKENAVMAIEFVLHKIDERIEKYGDRFPWSCSEKLVYDLTDNRDWTTSFWTGMLWLAYEVTGDNRYRQLADRHVHSFKVRLEQMVDLDNHDIGFLYSLSCVAAYKVTGSEEARQIALDAAKLLAGRFFEGAGIIQTRSTFDDPKYRGEFIIDCCMNLPLLYWACGETGDRSFYDKAVSHIYQAVNNLIREDASTFQCFKVDDTGKPVKGWVGQGFNNESCWSRGQTWGIYGLPLSYIHTGDTRLLDTAEKLANYFLNRLPSDEVCGWDLVFTGEDCQRDSSAAAIAACGLLELAKHLPVMNKNRRVYEDAAVTMIKNLTEKYTTVHHPESDGILLHGVYSYYWKGIDECCTWGDYFYFEALVRLVRDWEMYW